MVSFQEFFNVRVWKLQYIGLNELKPFQAQGVKRIVQDHYVKIKKFMPSDATIRYFLTEIKQYEEPKKQKKIKYSVHIRLATPFHVFSAERAHFDLNTALSWALKEMLSQVQKFKEKTRDRWRGYERSRRKVFGAYVSEKAREQGIEKLIRKKLVKRK